MSASNFVPKSDKVSTYKQTNKRPFFSPKMNKVYLNPILQNLKGRPVLNKNLFENDLFAIEPKKMPASKKLYLFRKSVKNAKW